MPTPEDNELEITTAEAERHHGGHHGHEGDGDFDCDPPVLTEEQRHEAIQKFAYFLWQYRGGGISTHEEKHRDWIEAEAGINSGVPKEQ